MGGQVVPEPFDVRTEEALDASMSVETTSHPKPTIPRRNLSPDREEEEEDPADLLSSHKMEGSMKKRRRRLQQPFNPFCNVDQVQLSIHCHVNGVNCLVCAPGMVTSDISESRVCCVSLFTSKIISDTMLTLSFLLLPSQMSMSHSEVSSLDRERQPSSVLHSS